MNPEQHYAYVNERFMEGKYNEWEAFAELLIVATIVLENPTQKHDRLAHALYAAKTMGMWVEAKREIMEARRA